MLREEMKGAFVILLFLISPAIIDWFLRVEFKVHQNGLVFLSGCSSGIGHHAAFFLASKGYTVFAGVRKDSDIKNLETQATSASLQGKLIPVILDVTKEETITSAFSQFSSFQTKTGLPFVGLVNNAGISSRGPFESLILNSGRNLFEINYWGAISLTQKFLPTIRRDKGRILFVSSLMAYTSLYGSSIYSGSKAALEATLDSLRQEMLEFGVSVSSIAPGYINTSIVDSGKTLPEGTAEQIALYQKWWDEHPKRREKSFKNSDPPQVTSDAIYAALFDAYPKTRYTAGGAGLLTGNLVIFGSSFLPDRLMDLLKKRF